MKSTVSRKINFFDINRVFLMDKRRLAVVVSLFILIMGFQYSSAYADYVTPLNMTFESGATFSGTLIFNDAMTDLVSANGALIGDDVSGPYAYGTRTISWVFYNEYSGSLQFGSSGVYADFLMSGTPQSPGSVAIEIDWFGGGSSLVLDITAESIYTFLELTPNTYPGNAVGYYDPMVSYNTNSTNPDPDPTPTPEPTTMLLLGLGLMGLAGIRRRIK